MKHKNERATNRKQKIEQNDALYSTIQAEVNRIQDPSPTNPPQNSRIKFDERRSRF